METITLILFALILTACLLLKLPTLYALFAGLILFCAYALKKGNSPKQIVSMLCTGVLTAKNILIVFVLIGMMTALWRACGTIPYIIAMRQSCCAQRSFCWFPFCSAAEFPC